MNEHVILLKKVLGPQMQCEKGDNISSIEEQCKPDGHWIVLGHVDEIYTYSLPWQKDFISMQNTLRNTLCNLEYLHQLNDGSVFYRPIYVFPEKVFRKPNSKDEWCAAFIRIHFAESINLNQQFDTLAQKIEKHKDIFSVRIFRATEFSDMLVELRSIGKLSELVHCALEIGKNKEIGKMYTYFGISADYLNGSELPDEDDKLMFWALRFSAPPFSVNSSANSMAEKYVKLLYDSIPGNAYCVTGSDDILICGTDVPTKNIVDIFRMWMKLCESNEPTVRTITRIGIRRENREDVHSSNTDDFGDECKNLADARDAVYQAYMDPNSSPVPVWFNAASELANSLIRMSRTPIMDELVYLLVPSLRIFFMHIKNDIDGGNKRELQSDMPYYLSFIDHCVYLTEQLLRHEDQLVPQSEIRPTVYDIPVFMLEYTLAFLRQVTNFLQKPDSNPLKYVFLPIPRLTGKVSTLEIFPPRNLIPGLIKIEFSAKDLYNPKDILLSLCHEISHYAGEFSRNREERHNLYLDAAAETFTREVLQRYDTTLIDFVREKIAVSFGENESLSDLEDKIEKQIRSVFGILNETGDKENYIKKYSEFIREYLSLDKSTALVELIRYNDFLIGTDNFLNKLKDISDLFREVYSDMCMFHMLEPSCRRLQQSQVIRDYVRLLLSEINSIEDCIQFSIRIYVCTKVRNQSLKTKPIEGYSEEWASIKGIIDEIECAERNDQEIKGFPYAIKVIKCLEDYAESCYIKLKEINADNNHVKEMYDALGAPDARFYRNAIDRIDEWRKDVMPKEKS